MAAKVTMKTGANEGEPGIVISAAHEIGGNYWPLFLKLKLIVAIQYKKSYSPSSCS